MKHPRTVWKAVQHWLNFEAECKRYALFTEQYMSYPIGQYLRERYGSDLRPEYPHPVLGGTRPDGGDLPRVDFAIVENKEVKFALETKWCFSKRTHGSIVKGIVRDLARLEVLTNRFSCSSYLLLGGKEKNLYTLFESKHFTDRDNGLDCILPVRGDETTIVKIRGHHQEREGYWRRALKPMRGCKISNTIKIKRLDENNYPGPQGEAVQVYAWRIKKRSRIKRSDPNCFIDFDNE